MSKHINMKVIQSLFAILILSLFSSPVWSETIDDLVERNGKHYLKFTDEGFSGKVEGKVQGTLKDGVWEGEYILPWSAHINSTLAKKQVSKNINRQLKILLQGKMDVLKKGT